MTEKIPRVLADTDALRIRRFEPGDVDPFARFMTDPESTRFLTFEEGQKTDVGACLLIEATIVSYSSKTPMLAFAVEESTTERFIGFCGLTPRGENVTELMYAIIPEVRGRGYATQIANLLVDYAFEQLGCDEVIAPISPDHDASIAVAERAGFVNAGLSEGLLRYTRSKPS